MNIYTEVKKTMSDKGASALAKSEGIKNKAYLDSKGIPTIGVGHTGPEVKLGLQWTTEKVMQVFKKDIARFERAVNKNVNVPLTQGQFDALVMLCFNIGSSAFRTSDAVTATLNEGEYEKAADGFLEWNNIRVNGKLEESKGLTTRRERERSYFLKHTP